MFKVHNNGTKVSLILHKAAGEESVCTSDALKSADSSSLSSSFSLSSFIISGTFLSPLEDDDNGLGCDGVVGGQNGNLSKSRLILLDETFRILTFKIPMKSLSLMEVTSGRSCSDLVSEVSEESRNLLVLEDKLSKVERFAIEAAPDEEEIAGEDWRRTLFGGNEDKQWKRPSQEEIEVNFEFLHFISSLYSLSVACWSVVS